MRRILLASCILAVAPLVSCLMPRGTPVLVEARTGQYWNGEGVLLEVSDDRQRCRVAVRSNAYIWVEKKWVPCQFVHTRTVRR
jgi:hypothetical protein